MSNSKLCTETKTFKNCGERIDWIIEQNKKRQKEEMEQYKNFLLNILNTGLNIGIRHGMTLEKTFNSFENKNDREMTKEESEFTCQIITDRALTEAIEEFNKLLYPGQEKEKTALN